MRSGSPFLFLLVLLFLVSSVAAQDTPIRVETNLVTLNVSVTDRSGSFVKGLTRDDFVLTEEGTDRTIDVFSANDGALSIGIVYDMHSANDQAASVLEALKRFTGRLESRDDYFITLFNEKGSLTTDFVPPMDQVTRHLSSPSSGARSLYDAIIEASGRTHKLRNAKKFLIVLSDGSDRHSEHSIKDLKARLRSINLPLYSLSFVPEKRSEYNYSDMAQNGPRQAFRIGETSELDRSVIAELSGTTGGEAYESTVRNRVYLSALATKFLQEARSQYVIGFYPESNDGKWRRLKVTVKDGKAKQLRIQSRKGYQSGLPGSK